MSLRGKSRYKSRFEKHRAAKRNGKLVLIFVAIALVILAWKNRIYLWDSIKFYL